MESASHNDLPVNCFVIAGEYLSFRLGLLLAMFA